MIDERIDFGPGLAGIDRQALFRWFAADFTELTEHPNCIARAASCALASKFDRASHAGDQVSVNIRALDIVRNVEPGFTRPPPLGFCTTF